jgi:hypothetical protein
MGSTPPEVPLATGAREPKEEDAYTIFHDFDTSKTFGIEYFYNAHCISASEATEPKFLTKVG